MNQCHICGKFRKYKDLVRMYQPDTHFTSEDMWNECKKCLKKSKNKAKVFKKQSDKLL